MAETRGSGRGVFGHPLATQLDCIVLVAGGTPDGAVDARHLCAHSLTVMSLRTHVSQGLIVTDAGGPADGAADAYPLCAPF